MDVELRRKRLRVRTPLRRNQVRFAHIQGAEPSTVAVYAVARSGRSLYAVYTAIDAGGAHVTGLVATNESHCCADITGLPLPSDWSPGDPGESCPCLSALTGPRGRYVLGGFVPLSAGVARITGTDLRTHGVAVERGVLLDIEPEAPVQLALYDGPSLVFAATRPQTSEEDLPPISDPANLSGDYREWVTTWLNEVLRGDSQAAGVVYSPLDGGATVRALRRLLARTPTLVSVEGSGSIYRASLTGAGGSSLELGIYVYPGDAGLQIAGYSTPPLLG